MTPPVARLVVHGSTEYDALVDLRRRVLRLPLGLDFTPEELAGEHDQTHIAVFADGEIVACATLVSQGDRVKIRQVAVEPRHQGHGLGTFVMERAEAEARTREARETVLHARADVTGFYERLGYTTEGEPLVEVGLPHRRMRKPL